MAAKSEFSKNHKKIRFVDISEISPERYITGHKETIESLKNRVNFPDSCPLNDNDAYHNGYETMVTAFCFALLTIDCETVGFFLKISKEIGKAWRKSLEAYF